MPPAEEVASVTPVATEAPQEDVFSRPTEE